MKNIYKYLNISGKMSWLAMFSMAVLLVFGTTSCDDLLNVIDPDIITAESINSEAGMAVVMAGSLGDMAIAMSGSSAGHGATAGLIVMSGLMSDEFDYSGTFPTRREGDTREVQNTNGTLNNIYGNLHRARAAAEATIDMAQSFGGFPDIESEMASIAGYVYVMFAETHCAGVPFSKAISSSELILGSPLSTDDMYGQAIVWFDQALGSTTTGTDLYYLASVGKARAMLGRGNITGAEGVISAANIPTDFEYVIEHSSNSRRQENGIYTMTATRRQYSIADVKGINGIDYRTRGTNGDPRVEWDIFLDENGDQTFGQDDITLYFNQLKYTSPSAPVVLASGIEARLIEAEFEADNDMNGNVASIHDALRATIGLGNVDLTGMTNAQLRKYHFDERALWLYATGHRHGDLRRLVRVYSEPIGDVFPWGDYFKGGTYGTTVTFPVPQSEANNPNYVSCLDENP